MTITLSDIVIAVFCFQNYIQLNIWHFSYYFYSKMFFSMNLFRLKHLKYILFRPNIDHINYKIDLQALSKTPFGTSTLPD